MRTGTFLARAIDFAARAPAETPAELAARIEELRTLWKENADLPLVAREEPALRALAARLFERRLELEGPWAALSGRFEAVSGDRARITYEFDDPRELEDFDPAPYGAHTRARYPALRVNDESFSVDQGRLVGLGRTSLRSRFDLGAPLTVRYQLEFGKSEVLVEDSKEFFCLGICDDGREHFLWAMNLARLQRYDPEDFEGTDFKAGSFFLESKYDLELRHDGSQILLVLSGVEEAKLATGLRKEGALFLWAHSELPVRVHRVEIEGALLPTSFDRLKEHWVESRASAFP